MTEDNLLIATLILGIAFGVVTFLLFLVIKSRDDGKDDGTINHALRSLIATPKTSRKQDLYSGCAL